MKEEEKEKKRARQSKYLALFFVLYVSLKQLNVMWRSTHNRIVYVSSIHLQTHARTHACSLTLAHKSTSKHILFSVSVVVIIVMMMMMMICFCVASLVWDFDCRLDILSTSFTHLYYIYPFIALMVECELK